MKYYLQVRSDGIVTDAITYPVEGYIEYETNDPLPNGFIGGWFKYVDGKIIECPELKPKTESVGLEELKQTIATMQDAIDTIVVSTLEG